MFFLRKDTFDLSKNKNFPDMKTISIEQRSLSPDSSNGALTKYNFLQHFVNY